MGFLGGEGLAPGSVVVAVVGLGLGVGVVEVDEGLEAGIEVLNDVGVGFGKVVDFFGVVVQVE